jgi:transcriptional regulator with XRE-family HTH domain
MAITAAQLKAARQLLGWSQTQLAAEARVSPTTVSHCESGRHRASPRIVSAIQRTLEAAGVEFTNGREAGVKLQGKG